MLFKSHFSFFLVYSKHTPEYFHRYLHGSIFIIFPNLNGSENFKFNKKEYGQKILNCVYPL